MQNIRCVNEQSRMEMIVVTTWHWKRSYALYDRAFVFESPVITYFLYVVPSSDCCYTYLCIFINSTCPSGVPA